MGYLNNSTVTVDAILTLKGRELLSKGQNSFNITQFALGDDEIDYSLWNTDHQLGSAYYGAVIDNMPITEAIPDETQALRYKLITLPKRTTNIPVITVGNTSITLSAPGDSAAIRPNTSNFQGGNSNLGYSAILADSTIADLRVTRALQNSILPTTPGFIGDSEDAQSITLAGFEFEVIAKTHLLEDKETTVTIVANETGGFKTVNILVKKADVATI